MEVCRPDVLKATANASIYRPFSDRIGAINVDVVHRLKRRPDVEFSEDDTTGTYFLDALLRWKDLNLTRDFESFLNDLGDEIQTLSQILHDKDRICAVFQKHLLSEESTALQPILELLVALSQDLQGEFYPFFRSHFLSALIDLLRTRDPEKLEWIFSALAFLYKSLWRHLVKDLDHVLSLVTPLLSDSKPVFIRRFAAESCAFLLRKGARKTLVFGLLIKWVAKQGNSERGLGVLLFEMVRGIKGHLHSCFEASLNSLWRTVFREGADIPAAKDLFDSLFVSVAQFLQPQQAQRMAHWLKDRLDAVLPVRSLDEVSMEEIRVLIRCVEICLHHRADGAGLQSVMAAMLDLILRLSDVDEPALVDRALSVLSLFWLTEARKGEDEDEQFLKTASKKLLSSKMISRPSLFRNFFVPLLRSSAFESSDLLPLILSHSSEADSDALCSFLARVALDRSRQEGTSHPIDLSLLETRPLTRSVSHSTASLLELLESCLQKSSPDSPSSVVNALVLIQEVDIPPECPVLSGISNALTNLASKARERLRDGEEQEREVEVKALMGGCSIPRRHKSETWLYLWLVLRAYMRTSGGEDRREAMERIFGSTEDLLVLVDRDGNEEFCLRVLDLSMSTGSLKEEGERIVELLTGKWIGNLLFEPAEVRQLTLSILSRLNDPIAKLCLAVEGIPPTVQGVRDRNMALRKLSWDQIQGNCQETRQQSVQNKIALHFVVSQFYVNLSLVWPVAQEVLRTHAQGGGRERPSEFVARFWAPFFNILEQVHAKVRQPSAVKKDEGLRKALSTVSSQDVLSPEAILLELLEQIQAQQTPLMNRELDHANARLHLLRAVKEGFPQLAQTRNRDLVALYLEFLSPRELVNYEQTEETHRRSAMVASC
ncbi:unnamed protein product [Cyprideis torosa]|uniref:Uncharacterized protein n=1 Tax=Cyprideis torosa TaxID=163714 RepID=A0A7R8ZKA1_9CRUS|nr:unnamed protein product [Cyprideis torosa]CAG0888849.1 unnamed protein product [Cyprideis torosa]